MPWSRTTLPSCIYCVEWDAWFLQDTDMVHLLVDMFIAEYDSQSPLMLTVKN